MSKENPETERASPPARPRRSSFAEMFGGRPSFDASSGTGNGGANKPGSLSMAMAQQSRARRLSVTTLGLSGSPTRASQGGSAFDTLKDKGHRESSGASEQAIEDEDGVAPLNGEGGSRPTSPTIGRRLSLGARAYRDSMRASSGGSAPDSGGGSEALGTSPGGATGGMKGSTPPGREDGFNWSESLRTRAQRSSISAGAGTGATSFMPITSSVGRAQSVAEPASSAPAPSAPQPKSPPPKAPDYFQERILKGDFYMD